MKKKLYDWENVASFLKKELKYSKSILTFGTIGSLNVNHDIDIIVTKKPSATNQNYSKELHLLFENLDNYIRNNFGKKVIRFMNLDHQDEVLRIGSFTKGDLALHVMEYTSLEHMSQIWAPDLKNNENIKDIIKNSYQTILGLPQDLFKANFLKRKNYDGLALKMRQLDRINSNFPENFLVEHMNHLFNYIQKYLEIAPEMKAKNRVEVKVIYYKLMNIIDEMD